MSATGDYCREQARLIKHLNSLLRAWGNSVSDKVMMYRNWKAAVTVAHDLYA